MDEKKRIKLRRIGSDKNRTLGIMHLISPGVEPIELNTLELPWLDNQRNISCIPAGKYNVIPIDRPSGRGWALLLKDVPGRSAILIHSGNFTWDIKGCILVGLNHVDINKDGIMDVSESKRAMGRLREWVGTTNEFEIEIIDDFYIGDLDPKTEKRI